MDVLSDVLRVIRLTGSLFFTAQFSSPWSLASPPSSELAPMLGKRADCISLFHVLVEGRCWFDVGGQPPVRVDAGTVIVVPHGDAHVMSSRPDLSPISIQSILPPSAPEDIPHIEHGSGGEPARFLCGYLLCDQRFNPLIGALPRLLVVRARPGPAPHEASAASEPAASIGSAAPDAWLELTLRRATAEADAKRPGSPAMVSRLTELLFMEVLRRHMQRLPAGERGWLAGVRDPEVGRALRLLHEQPARKWTTEDLGRAVGMSRSALAQRFRDLIGKPPMGYLASWRMQLAQHFLLQPALSISEVAAQVGYASDVAFNRAFKRHVGVPPAAWRRQAG